MSGVNQDPHAGQPIYFAGAPLQEAQAGVILLHGRGAPAEDILTLASEFGEADAAYLAPQAADFTWYPGRFLEPTQRNEPWLSSALRLVDRTVRQAEQAGLQTGYLILLGFSQGACLALEYTRRNPRTYGGVFGFSGGLIGADDETWEEAGDLAATPVFLGCSDKDPHIPEYRVHHAAQVFTGLGGSVETHIYPGMGHTINAAEIAAVQSLLRNLTQERKI